MQLTDFLTNWKSFVDIVLRKITSLHITLPKGKLSKLVQEGSVMEYRGSFEEMCTRVLGLPDYFVLEMFILGPKKEIQAEVVRGKPGDLQEDFDLALFVKNQLNKSTKAYSYKPKINIKILATNLLLPKTV